MTPTIEIISINDKQEVVDNGPFTPTDEQVVEKIQELFHLDPLYMYLGNVKLLTILKEHNKNWIFSEKKLKQIMKNNNLNNQQQQNQFLDKIQYSNSKKSLPDNLYLKYNDLKGNSIISSKLYKSNELIFEEKPLFFTSQLDHLNLVKSSKACTYCGSLLSSLNKEVKKTSFLNHLDCNNCSEVWCSVDCKKNDKLHTYLKHINKNELISSKNFNEYLNFCFNNGILQDFYSISIIKSYFLLDPTLKTSFFNDFAKVDESIRYNCKYPNLKIEQDQTYLQGFELFNNIFINDKIDFNEFTLMLGIFNLNNYQNSIFKSQSLINHNCENNIKIEINNDKLHKGLKVFASKQINPSNELVLNYVNSNYELNNRLKFLRLNYGFICHCSKCQSDNKALQRRKSSNSHNLNNLNEFKNLIKDNKFLEFDLPEDNEFNKERRKSVRFNEQVIAVNEVS